MYGMVGITMMEKYDGKLFFRNVDYLIKQQKRKVGEIEREAGVSTGYIARTSKAGTGKVGIGFIMAVASILGVKLDILLKVDLSGLDATETYLLSFLTKLINDTDNDLLTWKCEDETYLNALSLNSNRYERHPLFNRKDPELLADDSYKSSDCSVFKSNSFGLNTKISGGCYNTQLKNGACLYVMSIERVPVPGSNNPKDVAREVWLTMNGHKPQYLCSDWGGANLASVVDILYRAVQESFHRPKISQNCRDIIDAFMEDEVK